MFRLIAQTAKTPCVQSLPEKVKNSKVKANKRKCPWPFQPPQFALSKSLEIKFFHFLGKSPIVSLLKQDKKSGKTFMVSSSDFLKLAWWSIPERLRSPESGGLPQV